MVSHQNWTKGMTLYWNVEFDKQFNARFYSRYFHWSSQGVIWSAIKIEPKVWLCIAMLSLINNLMLDSPLFIEVVMVSYGQSLNWTKGMILYWNVEFDKQFNARFYYRYFHWSSQGVIWSTIKIEPKVWLCIWVW